MKVKILGEVSDRYTSCGDTVVEVEILEGENAGKHGYILLGISLPHGRVTEYPDYRIKRTKTEAWKS